MKENNINNTKSNEVQDINTGFSKYLKENNIKTFYQFDNFEFMAPDKDGLGLGETNVTVVEKEVQEKNGEKISIFEFYKDGELIASTNEKGELNLSKDYKESLKSRLKRIL